MTFKNSILTLFVLFIGCLTACKKKETTPDPPQPSYASRADLSRDSIFLYAKELYYWNTALPSYEAFNPRKFNTLAKDIDNYRSELVALAKSAINPATGTGYEYIINPVGQEMTKYSGISNLTEKNPVAYVPQENAAIDTDGNGNDLGLKLGVYYITSTPDPNDYSLFLNAVYPNSPADKAGLTRNNRITKINGTPIGANFGVDVALINTALSSANTTLELVRYTNGVQGLPFSVSLVKTPYKSSSVLGTNVFTSGAKKIGYLAYARFSLLHTSTQDLDLAFANFKAKGVTDLIIDLRYNGGGYINTAEYLINHIAPSSLQGKVMFSEHYNGLMKGGWATILKNQPYTDVDGKIVYLNGNMLTLANVNYNVASNTKNFVKNGPLDNVTNVVFIVSASTASASELVINALKPYVNVKLIGTKTYGKPIGFFPITIENKYRILFSLFQMKNALDQGDYYDGMVPDVIDSYDDPFYNFGEAGENYTAKAIDLLNGGVGNSSTHKTMSIGGKKVTTKDLKPFKMMGGEGFLGMIETRHVLK